MKVVLDTNVFMSGIFWSGPPSDILIAWQDKRFTLVLTTDIWDEYIRVAEILNKKYPSIELSEILDMVAIYGKFYEAITLPNPVSEDPDDDKFLACALAAKAKVIVSGYSDLLKVSKYSGVSILKPREFITQHLK